MYGVPTGRGQSRAPCCLSALYPQQWAFNFSHHEKLQRFIYTGRWYWFLHKMFIFEVLSIQHIQDLENIMTQGSNLLLPFRLCDIHWTYYLLGKRRLFFGLVALVCLSECLSVSEQHYSKRYERIMMKFYWRVWGDTIKNWLNFGGDLGLPRWVNEEKTPQ